MKIIIAIDSFKGSLTTMEAGNAAAMGIRRVYPDAKIQICPIADGGEGTTAALVSGLYGTYRTITVADPLGRPIEASYGILPNGTAIIEMAAASGLTLLSENERNPMNTTTYSFGQLIRDAVENGCRSFILGIGGSATNDGGTGCLHALGFEFLDKNGKQVPFGAKGLSEIVSISDKNILPELKDCTFHVACDVKNPLCGEDGCSAIFAPQKGADAEMIARMDADLRYFAELTKAYAPDADPDYAGAGAAGGLGFGLMSYLHAELRSGIDLIIRETKLDDAIRDADIVITGEGCLDAQTAMGKAPVGIARIAKKYGKPVIAFSGAVRDGAEQCNAAGIDAFFPILKSVGTLKDAMDSENAGKNLSDTAEQVFRIIKTIIDMEDKLC